MEPSTGEKCRQSGNSEVGLASYDTGTIHADCEDQVTAAIDDTITESISEFTSTGHLDQGWAFELVQTPTLPVDEWGAWAFQ